jgi:aryl-alcohol dehydrogenase-like predicted oxidoreductase
MIERKPFGRTGHASSRTIFGAAALSRVSQSEADRTLELLLEFGVNHIDTAASYGDAELRIGPWMKDHREDFFLATKTEQRSYQGAKEELQRSLRRLEVERIDLWQMHLLVDPREWEIAMGPGGALEAFIEARESGIVRFLGVTGHGLTIPSMHLRSLERYDFDSVLLPYNFQLLGDPDYAAGFERLLNLCLKRQVAVQTIKSLARGPKQEGDDRYAVWYDPLVEEEAVRHAVHWVLGDPRVFLNTVGDINLLPKVLQAADRLDRRPSPRTMESDLNSYGITPLFRT